MFRESRSAVVADRDAELWDGRFAVAPEWRGRLRLPRGAGERRAISSALAALGTGERPPPAAALARIPVADAADGVCVPELLGYDPGVPPVRFRPPHGVTARAVWLAPPGVRLMY